MDRQQIIKIVDVNMEEFFQATTKDLDEKQKLEIKNTIYLQTLQRAYNGLEKDFMKDNILKISDLKLLHSLIYPEGFKKVEGNNVMIAGEIRNYDLISSFTNSAPFAKPENILKELEVLIEKFNKSKKTQSIILKFVLDLVIIHPFGDGNGRLGAILGDLLLAKNGFSPVNIIKYKTLDKRGLYSAVVLSINKNDTKFLNDFLAKYKNV